MKHKYLSSENFTIKFNNVWHWRKKLTKTQINGSIYCVHGLEELTSLKCPYYPLQSIDSMQFLSRHKWFNHRTRINNPENLYGTTKYPQKPE